MTTAIREAIQCRSPRLLLALAIMLAALASGYGLSQVRASHGDPNEVHFCVNIYTGQTRHVEDPAQCVGGEVVTVNQEGPAGPQGPQGDQGPPGPEGPEGPAGPASTIIRDALDDEIAPGLVHETVASCEPGEVATGGGYFSTAINLVYPRYVGPGPGGTNTQPTEWRVIWVNNTAADGIGGVWVICAP